MTIDPEMFAEERERRRVAMDRVRALIEVDALGVDSEEEFLESMVQTEEPTLAALSIVRLMGHQLFEDAITREGMNNLTETIQWIWGRNHHTNELDEEQAEGVMWALLSIATSLLLSNTQTPEAFDHVLDTFVVGSTGWISE